MSRPPQLGILQTALLNSSETRLCMQTTTLLILHPLPRKTYLNSTYGHRRTPPLRLSNHRPPLAEKQLNTMSPRRSLATVTLADSQATFLVHGNMAGESKLAPHSPLALDAMQLGYSFHPLPPLSSSSSLQLPIFLEQPFVKPSLEPPNPTSPLPKPLPTIPLPTESILKPSNNHHHTGIPALSHPNSPYVPWSLSERRSFIRPQHPHLK
ncbi:hypothetical protein BD779DRAFT_17748 [Infundibulicybe gibba]|nr:hypothetical protein BD779DRAFT_17748 [Infundibulicybe gibba]